MERPPAEPSDPLEAQLERAEAALERGRILRLTLAALAGTLACVAGLSTALARGMEGHSLVARQGTVVSSTVRGLFTDDTEGFELTVALAAAGSGGASARTVSVHVDTSWKPGAAIVLHHPPARPDQVVYRGFREVYSAPLLLTAVTAPAAALLLLTVAVLRGHSGALWQLRRWNLS